MSILQFEFRNGLAYEYFGVPAALNADLLSAESKAAFDPLDQRPPLGSRGDLTHNC